METRSKARTRIGTFAVTFILGMAAALAIRCAVRGEGEGEAETAKTAAGNEHAGRSMPEMPPEAPPAPKGVLLDLGNELCPVMKNPANKNVYTDWRGLRIGHCCAPCKEKLLEDPERILDEAGIEWRAAAEAAAAIESASGAERDRLLAAARDQYRVIRER